MPTSNIPGQNKNKYAVFPEIKETHKDTKVHLIVCEPSIYYLHWSCLVPPF